MTASHRTYLGESSFSTNSAKTLMWKKELVTRLIAGAALLGASTVLTAPAMAQSSAVSPRTGTMEVSLELKNACAINGSGTGNVDFGNLDFGEQSTAFGGATATLDLGTQLNLQCPPNRTVTLKILGSGNGATDENRTLLRSGGSLSNASEFVTYTLRNASNVVLDNDDTITATSNGSGVISFVINGVANAKSGMVAGLYSDIVNLELTL